MRKVYDVAFDELKQRLTSALVLAILDGSSRMAVYSDASGRELSCVLM